MNADLLVLELTTFIELNVSFLNDYCSLYIYLGFFLHTKYLVQYEISYFSELCNTVKRHGCSNRDDEIDDNNGQNNENDTLTMVIAKVTKLFPEHHTVYCQRWLYCMTCKYNSLYM